MCPYRGPHTYYDYKRKVGRLQVLLCCVVALFNYLSNIIVVINFTKCPV